MHFCTICNYTSPRKYNVDRHVKRRHENPQNVASDPQNVAGDPQNVAGDPSEILTCEQCAKVFSRKDNLTRHMMNCDGIQSLECSLCHTVFKNRWTKSRHVQICTGPTATTNIITTNNTINNINQGTINNNNIQITINNFGEENLSYISQEFLEKCFNTEATGIRTVLDKIYFDHNHPENHNVRLTSLRHAITEVYKDNQWIPKGLYDTIEKMILKSTSLIITTLVTTTTPTEETMDMLRSLQSIPGKSKTKLFNNAKGNLIARRKSNEIYL